MLADEASMLASMLLLGLARLGRWLRSRRQDRRRRRMDAAQARLSELARRRDRSPRLF